MASSQAGESVLLAFGRANKTPGVLAQDGVLDSGKEEEVGF